MVYVDCVETTMDDMGNWHVVGGLIRKSWWKASLDQDRSWFCSLGFSAFGINGLESESSNQLARSCQ